MTEEWAPEAKQLLAYAIGQQLARRVQSYYLFGLEQERSLIAARKKIREAKARRKKQERAEALEDLQQTWRNDPLICRVQTADTNTPPASCRAIGSDRLNSWPSPNKALSDE